MSGTTLSTELRRSLEKTIREARQVAEVGAQDAIRRLGVAESSAPTWLDEPGKALRRRLRAHARSLGDAFDRATERQEVDHLIGASAYAHWHRMLFARFLAERDLLRHPEHDVAISLADCEELAAEENLPDRWAVAERYAAAMLPGVFLPEDPVLALEVAPEHTHRLQALVQDLDNEIFQASDSLGWTYQFWRGAEKEKIDHSVKSEGLRIGANELPAVTQLFTESYMVHFVLHNTLGAWWAGKVLAQRPDLAATAADEAALRAACALPGVTWDMLRFIRDGDLWRPASGAFPGWPDEAKAITALDPCCGSGHFLTEALPILAALRQSQEGLSARDAIAAVLRDNLFGLEIDGRCVQIATFAVALNAWAVGGWQSLPQPHIAWVGAPPPLPRQDFIAMANGDDDLRSGLAALHDLFSLAPLLGSLIEPVGGDLMSPQRLGRIEPLFEKLLEKARRAEPEIAEGAIAACGMADAALILSRQYVLQSTNVPFLGRGKQTAALAEFIERAYPEAKADLSTTMLARMVRMAAAGGTVAAITPQNWLFLGSYKSCREEILNHTSLNIVADLGPAAFKDMNWWAARTAIIIYSKARGSQNHSYAAINADTGRDFERRIENMPSMEIIEITQSGLYNSNKMEIVVEKTQSGRRLSEYSDAFEGMSTGDNDRYRIKFWEVARHSEKFTLFQASADPGNIFSGFSYLLRWEAGNGSLSREPGARVQGQGAWSKFGYLVSVIRNLQVSIKLNVAHEKTTVAIIPKNKDHAAAIFTYLDGGEFKSSIRSVNKKLSVATSSVSSAVIDIEKYKDSSVEKYGAGLPEPYSDDPTQWLFHGHPASADTGSALHVALARLAGYRWPSESDAQMRLSVGARKWIALSASLPTADDDGILCLPAVAGERPLSERLRVFLAAAFGDEWSETKERQLIADADARFEKKEAKDRSLDGWLRERAFRQHCALFHDRPFLWQIWDGMKDGFSAFLHYHRLDQATLRKLTYTTLGDWLARAKAEGSVPRQEKGRELQQELEKILEGEDPYDIFVRWKPLARQPLGWDPDLDDGVRMNIRPFMTAGILRDTPSIKWGKDRGGDVPSAPWYDVHKGERINDHHTTLAEKRAARGEGS